jgi:hypothetical protein
MQYSKLVVSFFFFSGVASDPRLGVICAIQKNKNDCLDRMAIDTEASTASCIWRQVQSNFITDIQNFSTRVGSSAIDVAYDASVIDGGICGASFNTSLASGMKSKVGVVVQQLGKFEVDKINAFKKK